MKKSISIILLVVMLLGIIASASMTAFAEEIRWGDYYCSNTYHSNDERDLSQTDSIEGNWNDDGKINYPTTRTQCPFTAPAGKRFKCWANKPEAATEYLFPTYPDDGSIIGYGSFWATYDNVKTFSEFGNFYAFWEDIDNPVCIVGIIGGERYLPDYPPVICNKYGTISEPKDINNNEEIIGWYTNRTVVETGYDFDKGEMSYEYEYDEKDRYDFSSPVTTDFTLYARTVKKGEVVNNPHGTVGSTKWEYDITTSTFTVSGSGSFDYDDDANDYLYNAKNFVVENGVTALGEAILLNSDKIETVNIAGSVKSIGADCFQNCEKLRSVTLGEGIETIGSGTFSELPLVSEIKIPASVKTIGDGAFSSNSDSFKLIGKAGSAAQTYAEANGIKFEVSEGTEPTGTQPTTTEPIGTQPTTEKPTEKGETQPTTTEPIGTQPTTEKPTENGETKPTTATDPVGTTAPATTRTVNFLPDKSVLAKSDSVKLVIQDSKGDYFTYTMEATPMIYDGIPVYTVKIPADINPVMSSFQYYKDDKWVAQTNVTADQLKAADGKIVNSDGSVYDYGKSSDKKPTVKTKKANPVKVTVKTKTVKLKNLKKKAQTVKAITVKNAKGKVTYKLTSVPKKIKKLTKISSKGAITIKKWKKAKKGTYKFKVNITAAGNADYNKKSVTKTVSVKIK